MQRLLQWLQLMGKYISNQILVLHKAMWLFMGKLNGAYEWNYSANTKQLQIFITGFKFIQSNITYNLYVDESQRLAQIRVNRSNVTIGTGDGFNYSDFTIPSQYRPKSNSFVSVGRNAPSILNYVWTDGTIGIFNNTGNQWTNYTLAFQHEWHY